MHASTLFASLMTVALATLANAHGIVYQIEVAGQTFTGPLINGAGDTGPFYVPTDNSPITDVTSDNMFCGSVGKTPTSTPSLDLSQGNTISFYWNSGYAEGTLWLHNTGPMFLYMAKCDSNCSSMTASSTNFIKIEQQGFTSDGTWAQAAVHSGSPATFTIPSDLASGNYLVRHEIINLASTDENYPACSQFAITGGSNDYSSAQTGKFPGAYSASDAGLTVAGGAVYSIKSNSQYTFPGPDPIESTSSSNSTSSVTASSSGTAVPSAASSSSSSASSTGGSTGSTGTVATASHPASSSSTSSSGSAGSTGTVTTSEAVAATTSTGSDSSSSDADSCTTQWTACNAAYSSASPSYDCQQAFNQCVARSASSGSVSSSNPTTTSISARPLANHHRRHHAGLSRLDKSH